MKPGKETGTGFLYQRISKLRPNVLDKRATDIKVVDPTCCNKPRTLLLWEHAATWCDQTLAWCRRLPCLGSPSPGLRRTWQRQRAWPTERWPQQTLGWLECPQPSGEDKKEQSEEHWTRTFSSTPAAKALNSPQPHPRSEIPEHFLKHTEWKSPFRSPHEFAISRHHTCYE